MMSRGHNLHDDIRQQQKYGTGLFLYPNLVKQLFATAVQLPQYNAKICPDFMVSIPCGQNVHAVFCPT